MKKKLLIILILIIIFAFPGIILFNRITFNRTVEIKLICPGQSGEYPYTYKNEQFAERFNKRAKKEYRIKVISGGAVAKPPEYFDAVRVGAIEMADASWGSYSEYDPEFALSEIPFLFNNLEAGIAASKQLESLYDKILQEKFNMKGMGLVCAEGLELVSTKPVRGLEDIKGLVIGSFNSGSSAHLKELGAIPVEILKTNIAGSITNKVIDAAMIGTHDALTMGLTDICKYCTFCFLRSSWSGYLVNLDVWNKMPEHIRVIFSEEIEKTADWLHSTMIQLGDEDLTELKEKEIGIYILPESERQKWVQLISPFRENQLSKYGDFGKSISQIAEKVNKQNPYKEKEINNP